MQKRFLQADAVYSKMKASQRESLRLKLVKIRKQGWHFAPSTRRIGLDVACIIGNPQVGVSAALGVPFLAGGSNEGKERSVVPAIRKCADDITFLLGVSRQEATSA